MAETEDSTLPFSDTKQQAVIGFLLTNEKFFKQAYSKISKSWFLSSKCGEILEILKIYFEEYNYFPTIHAFMGSKELTKLDLRKANELKNLATVCISAAQQFRLEEIKQDLSEWFHATVLMSAMNKASNFYKQKDLKATHIVLDEAVKEVNSGFFHDGMAIDFENFEAYLKEFELQKEGALTTGLPILDKAILKDAKGGCLLPGDSTIIMAPVNCGKSTVMQSIACHNIRRGKDVLYLTHEGNPDYIRLQFLSNILKCPVHEIFDLKKTSEGKARIKETAQLLQKHLKYVPYNRANHMVVEEVSTVICQEQEQRKAELGKGYDLLIDDYPAVLNTTLAYKGTLQKRNSDQIVYGLFIQLALEHRYHFIGAIQTNREGSKVNKHLDGNTRILVPEDVQESFGPIQSANNVLSFNRSVLAEKMGIATFGIGKTRTNAKGMAVVCKTNFPCSETHSGDLGGMLYYGTNTLESQFEKLFARYKNDEIMDDLRSAF